MKVNTVLKNNKKLHQVEIQLSSLFIAVGSVISPYAIPGVSYYEHMVQTSQCIILHTF